MSHRKAQPLFFSFHCGVEYFEHDDYRKSCRAIPGVSRPIRGLAYHSQAPRHKVGGFKRASHCIEASDNVLIRVRAQQRESSYFSGAGERRLSTICQTRGKEIRRYVAS